MLIEVDVAVPDAPAVARHAFDAAYSGRLVDRARDSEQRLGVVDVIPQVQRLAGFHVDHRPKGGSRCDPLSAGIRDDEIAGSHQTADLADPCADRIPLVFGRQPVDLDGHARQDPGRVFALQVADSEPDPVRVFAGGMQNTVAEGDDRGPFGQVHLAGLHRIVVSCVWNFLFHLAY